LDKPVGGSFGFSIHCREIDDNEYLFVKKVHNGGLAEQDGRLNVGDRLLQVM